MSSTPSGPPTDCTRCGKPEGLCVCTELAALPKLAPRLKCLILQHPQEPDHELGTARLTEILLPGATVRVGLSWPNLAKASGSAAMDPKRWAVLHLGSGVKGPAPAGPGLWFVDKKGALRLEQPKPRDLDGLIVLDGTWSQAKTLWWRNAWMLKLPRAILVPSRKSLYGALRREPRRECVATIEAIAESLTFLGEPAAIGENLRAGFSALLEKKQRPRKPDALP